ncbi:hypothetical protein C0V97_01600 [Asaia sp. W19]|uniref:glycosyltransferase family A protein n=1 Tax=unclassified Asaia TaxID=2685023 RepID=UPI000F8F7F9B|nr:glycosyltransferase family A protein [Asaia sp. W19]RUT27349.1 hypothetical protein C0V97_01600 [Asaia sp. W19]
MTFPASDHSGVTPADVAVVMRIGHDLTLIHRGLTSILFQKFRRWHLYLVCNDQNLQPLIAVLEGYLPIFGGRLTLVSSGEAARAAFDAGAEDFIVFHDAGDTWDPDFLLNTVLFLGDPKKSDYVAVATNCMVIDERVERDGRIIETGRHVWGGDGYTTDYATLFNGRPFPPICCLFKRSALPAIGLEQERLTSDWERAILLMEQGDIGHIQKIFASWHRRDGQSTIRHRNASVAEHEAEYLQTTLLKNAELRRLIAEQPAMRGLFMTILPKMQRQLECGGRTEHSLGELRHRVHSLDHRIDDLISMNRTLVSQMGHVISELDQIRVVASWQRKMLRPVHRVWLMAMPFRRFIAKCRGRT